MIALVKFLCRLIPATTFIFSGWVKAVDPSGGAIKFHDYFVAFHIEWLTPIAMPLSIILAAAEFLLGFYLLLGIWLKQVTKLVLGLMGAFTLLTFYIAIYNPVSDCGCFGDAITITNWQTFWKNVIVIIFAYGAYYFRNSYQGPGNMFKRMVTAASLAIYIIWFSFYNINNLPVIDFRDFKAGTHTESLITIPEGAEAPVYETIFILEKDGQKQTFTVDDYPYDDTTWVFVDSKTKTIKEGYIPPMENMALSNDLGDDYTQEIVHSYGPVFLLISPKIKKMAPVVIPKLAELNNLAGQRNIPFYTLTASNPQEVDQFESDHQTMFEYLYTDEVTLKTMIRSNPGLILLHDGVVISKWHYNNLPDKDIIYQPLSKGLTQQYSHKNKLVVWLHILSLILLPLIIFSNLTINKKR